MRLYDEPDAPVQDTIDSTKNNPSPSITDGGAGALPSMWLIGMIIALVGIRFATRYVE